MAGTSRPTVTRASPNSMPGLHWPFPPFLAHPCYPVETLAGYVQVPAGCATAAGTIVNERCLRSACLSAQLPLLNSNPVRELQYLLSPGNLPSAPSLRLALEVQR